MRSLEDYRKPEFVKQCQDIIENFLSETPGILNALIATIDGFEVASHIARSEHSADNLAAVGSSMFAMGTSLVEQFGLEGSNSITIDSDSGKIYIRGISNKQDGNDEVSLVLLLQTTKKAMLAHVMHGSNKLAEAVLAVC